MSSLAFTVAFFWIFQSISAYTGFDGKDGSILVTWLAAVVVSAVYDMHNLFYEEEEDV